MMRNVENLGENFKFILKRRLSLQNLAILEEFQVLEVTRASSSRCPCAG